MLILFLIVCCCALAGLSFGMMTMMDDERSRHRQAMQAAHAELADIEAAAEARETVLVDRIADLERRQLDLARRMSLARCGLLNQEGSAAHAADLTGAARV